ncbi:MAG: tetratricopeptide repeat protein, partial [Planctomycetota bacterium]
PTATKPTETNHIETFILHHHTLVPLKQLTNKSPYHRDALYSILAGALETESLILSRTTFALQLIAGAAVIDARINRSASHSATDKRLHEVIDTLENTSFEVSPDTLSSIAELSYLTAQAHYLTGRHLTAVNKLLSYVDSYQSHDRAADAARQAVAIAQEMLNKPQWRNSAKARTAFVRAAKLMQKHFPDSPQARRLQYFIALTLEQNQKLTEAADEYARVAIDDPDALKAALGRTRCLKNTLNHAAANRTLSESEIKKLAQKTLRAAQQGVKTAGRIIHQQSTKDDRCLTAEIVLTLANLLNTSHINTPAQALTTLQNFETRFAECPESIGPALRQRILAHRELKQLAQARQVVQQYLSTSPDTAGPVMARLLEAMRNEIDAAADRGNKQEQTDIAAEAHQLAKMLIDWSEQRPQQVSPTDLLTIRTWQAWSLLNAGKPADAFSLYQTCQKIGDHLLPANSTSNMEIRLGKAECLLALGKVNDALPIFMNVWQNSPEHSTPWWRSFVGCLESHNRLKKNPNQILQSIHQQKHLSPDLGGPRWKRALENIEKTNQNRIQNSTHQ